MRNLSLAEFAGAIFWYPVSDFILEFIQPRRFLNFEWDTIPHSCKRHCSYSISYCSHLARFEFTLISSSRRILYCFYYFRSNFYFHLKYFDSQFLQTAMMNPKTVNFYQQVIKKRKVISMLFRQYSSFYDSAFYCETSK